MEELLEELATLQEEVVDRGCSPFCDSLDKAFYKGQYIAYDIAADLVRELQSKLEAE